MPRWHKLLYKRNKEGSRIKNIIELIKVKTIVTIIVLAVWAYLAIIGTVNADAVNNVTLMVIAFYFGTQHERQGKE